MVKESPIRPPVRPYGAFFVLTHGLRKESGRMKDKKAKQAKVIAYRRACKASADGTGLSHYILMDRKK